MTRLRAILLGAAVAGAALGRAAPAVEPAAAAGDGETTVRAERMSYDRDAEVLRYTGDVVVERGDTTLRADEITINRQTGLATAVGRVHLVQGATEWRGDRLEYNLHSRDIRSGRFDAVFPPYFIWAGDAAKEGAGDSYNLESVTFSTCTNPAHRLHYRLRAARAYVVPDSYVSARHAVLFLGPVPVMYSPYLRASLGERGIGVRFKPGYRSRMGAFLLSGLTYDLTEAFEGQTLLDYRTARGVAVGQEVEWRTPQAGLGAAHVYYAKDTGVDYAKNDYPTNRIPDDSRYRLTLKHGQNISADWRIMGEVNYLSDAFVLEDFYKSEYRRTPEPLNFAMVSHYAPDSAFSVLAKWRLNDFYTTVSRLPEVRHETFLRPLGDSGYFHEGYQTLAYLRKEWAAWRGEDDVALLRADTRHFFYRPTRQFDFLNVTPRAGVQATFYSKSRERETVQTFVTVTNTLPDGTEETVLSVDQTEVVYKDGGAILRPLFEVGTEASFKAFRMWSAGPASAPVLFRHIVEPYANLTVRPNLLDQEREDFYQFDAVDEFGPEHSLRLGTRQAVQFKKDGRIFELIDLDVYATYYAESQEHGSGLGPFVWRVEMNPSDAFRLDLDGAYHVNDSELQRWSVRARLRPRERWFTDLEYRFRNDVSSLALGRIAYSPSAAWSFEARVRFNLEDSRLEEHGYEVERVLDCLGVRIGVSHEPGYTLADGRARDDDISVYGEIWLTAFPNKRWGNDR